MIQKELTRSFNQSKLIVSRVSLTPSAFVEEKE